MRNGLLAALFTVLTCPDLGLAQAPAEGTLLSNPGLTAGSAGPLPCANPLENVSPVPSACCSELLCAPHHQTCGPEGRFWASAEYLLWWFQGDRLPPLVTTSPAASSGVLGAPGTTVLFGGSRLEDEAHSGARFTLGYWLNDCQTLGVEGNYFFLGSRSREFTAGGNGLAGSPVLARPVVNALTGTETAQLVSFPGALAGTVHASASSRLEGAGVNGLANLCCSCCSRVDFLAGFRYLELREGVGIQENLAVNPAVPTIGGSTFSVADQFDTRNRFYGGQLGARAEYRRGNAFLDLVGGVALGNTHEEVDIRGSTVITPPGGVPTMSPGGVLALPSNSGHFSRDRFTVVPEVGINVGYQVTEHMRAFVGYSFLYSNHVVRPGEVIDRTVNLSQIPSNQGAGPLTGPARPTVQFKDTDFWAQGVNFGVEFRF